MENLSILLVDDEPNVLSSLSRILDEQLYDVKTAESGPEGIETIRNQVLHPFSVIISDYHMPGMDGVSFLEEVRKMAPDATRMLLTGAAGIEMAIDAVNRGQIYRFLLKPCPSEQFLASVQAGVRQYHLVTGERELLNKTLNGSIRILVDVLSSVSPETFMQASRLRDRARGVAVSLGYEQIWEVELSAMLCRIGSVAVPPDVMKKWRHGIPLNANERSMIDEIPSIGRSLVNNIPRLDDVANGIGSQNIVNNHESANDPHTSPAIRIGKILKIVVDFDHYVTRYGDADTARQVIIKNRAEYDPAVFNIFIGEVLEEEIEKPVAQRLAAVGEMEISVENIQPGMVLSRDVLSKSDRLIVAKGTVVTQILKYRLENYFWTRSISEKVYVLQQTKLEN